MKHEGVRVGAELRDDERNLVHHQAADEMHIAADPVEFGRNDWAPRLSGSRQRGSEFRTTVERVVAFAGFNLEMLCNQSEPFRCPNRWTAALWASIPSPDLP